MPQRTQALFLAAAFVLGGLVTAAFLLSQFQTAHNEQRSVLARETAATLAAALVHDTTARDALSLTVVLREAIGRGVVASAAVYDNAGGLLVTVGAPARDTQLHSSEIATLDTVVGRIQITLVDANAPGLDWLFLPLAALALLVLGAWQWARLLPTRSQVSETGGADGESDGVPLLHEQVQVPLVFGEESSPEAGPNGTGETQPVAAVLVVKVEPPRLADELTTAAEAVADEHAGRLSRTANEYCLHLDSAMSAVSAAVTLEETCPPRLTLKMGTHCIRGERDADALLKRARYLASLATRHLLASNALIQELTPGDFTVERFHSSFAPDDLYEVS